MSSLIDFREIHTSLVYCLESLSDFVLNTLPSNISMEEEFGIPSRRRQQVLVDIDICQLITTLVERLFPNLKDLGAKEKKVLVSCHDHINSYKKKTALVEKHTHSKETKIHLF